MKARNSKQVQDMLIKQIEKAMRVVSKKAEGDMYEETAGFYANGKDPQKYKRTGALGDTPRTTALSKDGNSVAFEAYLNQDHQYTTGKKPSMTAVLHVANDHSMASKYGLRPPVGKEGFWDRAEESMEKTLDKTMKKFFK